ncbi:hypothetical protein GCM10029976_024300 [Kribbella albertanoniae]|uniref:DUF3043 domain-containing protein n=1 Tax=Kribbella albertanoniae TaxID=1266829 RepID=A0A4R4PXA0_9ACTN|nr:DUF3043 domain-containing protein [Kribbella albertanoniae]TDC27112.1 DUF3043 domain-containing protein [Kribbella albertanoniae]
MFRRTKSDTTTPTVPAEPQAKPGGKGRPTPSRKEAEQARKAAYKKPRNRKEASALRREKMRTERAKMQSALQTGDDRYLPAADKGPVRRFARDYVDARYSVMEFALPILLVVSLVGVVFSRQFPWLAGLVNIFFLVMIMVIAGDWFLLSRGMKRAVAKRYPDEPVKGIGFYAVRRTMQMRRWRLPKPMVKRGEFPM